jgi:hypothetical protein
MWVGSLLWRWPVIGVHLVWWNVGGGRGCYTVPSQVSEF